MIPLTFIQENKEFIIKEIKGRDKDKSQLIEKGFCIGNKLCLLTDDNRNYIVKLNGTKYILNFSLANKILLEECK